MHELARFSNDHLVHRLHALVGSHRRVTAELIVCLGEVDSRRIHAEKGFPSLFAYCVEELRFSEDEACRRIDAARLAHRFREIVPLLETAAVSLSVLGLLKPHLAAGGAAELLAGVSGKSVREAKEWLAARFPAPDVPSTIRRVPLRAPAVSGRTTVQGRFTPPAAAHGGELAQADLIAEPAATAQAVQAVTAQAATARPTAAPGPSPTATLPSPATSRVTSRPTPHSEERLGSVQSSRTAPSRVRVEPIAADRFVVKFTASRTFKDKLTGARDLLLHANPDGDLGVVFERALDVLLHSLQSPRHGRTTQPARPPRVGQTDRIGQTDRVAQTDRVTQTARRDVFARDGSRCSFVGDDGRRCGATGFLEVDHVLPRALGGTSSPENLRVLCRAHNRLEADRAFDRTWMITTVARAHEDRTASPECPSDDD